MKTKLWLFGAFLGAALLPTISQAQDDAWEFRFTPYVWAPSLNTELTIGSNPPVDSNADPLDLLDLLDFAFLATGEVRKGDWGVIAEFNYLALSHDATIAGGLGGADAKLEGVMGGAALAYRFYGDDSAAVDVFGGFRIWSLEATIDFDRLPSVSRKKTFIDPIFGLRGSFDLNEHFFVGGLAEIGGFGAGSELQWELVGRAGYRISDTVNAAIGYRHLALDFDNGRLDLDVTMTGPFLAIDFTW